MTPPSPSPPRPTPTRKPAAQRPARRVPLVPLVLGLIVVVGLLGVLASRRSSPARSSSASPSGAGSLAETRPVQVTGTPLAPLEGSEDAAIGKALPELHGQSFDGADIAITADGAPKVIFFVAHWCPHCQREVPLIADWLRKNGDPQGVGLYSVATSTSSSRPNYPPSAWLARERWRVPVLVDDEKFTAARAAGLTAFPFFVATDCAGKVIARTSGELSIAELEKLIAAARATGGKGQG